MKRKSKEIALTGISSAFTLICITASMYVEVMTLTFAVLSAIFLLLPFTKDFWVGGIIGYVACSICAFFIGNINSVPFIVFFGAYTIIQWSVEYKLAPKLTNKIVKYSVSYLIKIAYLEIAVAIIWFLASAVIPTIVLFGKEIKLTYLIISLGSIPLFLLYDLLMHFVFINLKVIISKRIKDNDVTTQDDITISKNDKIDVFGLDEDKPKDDYDSTLQDFLKGDDNQNIDKKENDDNKTA